MTKVVVTGIGAVAANGSSAKEIFDGCVEKRSGLKECALFDPSLLRTPFVGEIRSLPKKDRVFRIIEHCCDQALEDASFTADDFRKEGIRGCLCFATLLASIENIRSYVSDDNADALCEIPSYIDFIHKKYGVLGASYTDSSACAAGTTALGIAFDLISENKADVVLVGGADPLTDFACYGFHSLQSLSTDKCKPFDVRRDGINLGEGGAFFVVESEEHAKKRGAKIRCEIVGYGINNDAYHITGPDPEVYGACASMKEACKTVSFDKIDYVNTHGTGTILNDAMEMTSLKKLPFKKDLVVSSTKPITGHCLAAAGAIEAAITMLALENNVAPPTANLTDKEENCASYVYPQEALERELKYALSDSFAFGGNTASVLLKKYED